MKRIERALISVYDKTGIVEFAKGLAAMDVEIISTGGTARLLSSNGLRVREVSDLTGFPEILDGRVKTLNPRISCESARGKRTYLLDLYEHDDGMRPLFETVPLSPDQAARLFDQLWHFGMRPAWRRRWSRWWNTGTNYCGAK